MQDKVSLVTLLVAFMLARKKAGWECEPITLSYHKGTKYRQVTSELTKVYSRL